MDTQIGKVTKGLHPGSTMLAHQPERCPWKGREAEDYRPETNRMFLINFRWRSSSAFEDPPRAQGDARLCGAHGNSGPTL